MKLALISLFVGSAAAFSAVSDSPPYILPARLWLAFGSCCAENEETATE